MTCFTILAGNGMAHLNRLPVNVYPPNLMHILIRLNMIPSERCTIASLRAKLHGAGFVQVIIAIDQRRHIPHSQR